MHHCLEIDEILELILDATLKRRQNYELILDKPSLLALLRTCRSFSIPATKLLWRYLPNLAPLILAMPEDLVQVEETGEREYFIPRTVIFRRHAVAADWKRFDFYAQFVRELGCIERLGRSMANFLVLDGRIRQELQKRDKVLLPNLRRLTASSNDLSFVSILLNPCVQHLQLNLHPAFIPSFLQLVDNVALCGVTAPKSLRLAESTTWTRVVQALIIPALSTLLDALDLEDFDCNWLELSDEILKKLIRMPRLRTLEICQSLPSLASTLDLVPFGESQLEKVSLWTDNFCPSFLPQIIANLKPSLLQTLSIIPIEPYVPCNRDDLHGLIYAIHKHCSPDIFTGLTVGNGLRQPQGSAVVDYKLLSPLFSFSKLTRLYLTENSFDLDDAEVKELAKSWPLLELLDVQVDTLHGRHPRATLRCLLWFAMYCRNLWSLSFTFYGIDTFSDTEMSAASGHPLRTLSVGCSTISAHESTEVAQCLNTVFPHLMLFIWDPIINSGDLSIDSSRHKTWEEVRDKIL